MTYEVFSPEKKVQGSVDERDKNMQLSPTSGVVYLSSPAVYKPRMNPKSLDSDEHEFRIFSAASDQQHLGPVGDINDFYDDIRRSNTMAYD